MSWQPNPRVVAAANALQGCSACCALVPLGCCVFVLIVVVIGVCLL